MLKQDYQAFSERAGEYFTKLSGQFADEYTKTGLKKHIRPVLAYFRTEEVKDLSVLELGCGIGGLLIELLELGVRQVIGMDASEGMIRNAKELAQVCDRSGAATYLVGDFNNDTTKLPITQADVVIADRVFCCSPVAMDILTRMLSLHPRYIVIALPRRNLIYRKLWRLKVYHRNWKMGIGRPTKSFHYPVREIDQKCLDAGMKRDYHSFRYVWEVLIYKRVPSMQMMAEVDPPAAKLP